MGRATARLFADEGAHVAVTDLEQGGVDTVVGEIVDAGLSARGWTLDVADGLALWWKSWSGHSGP
jgi:3-oxoacyl-[acyl-carrier protein] reductase